MTEWWAWDRPTSGQVRGIRPIDQNGTTYYVPWISQGSVNSSTGGFNLSYSIASTRTDGTHIGNRVIAASEVLFPNTWSSWGLPPVQGGDGFTWFLTLSYNYNTPGVGRFLVTALAIDISDPTLPIVAKGYYYLPEGIGRHAPGSWDAYLGVGISHGAHQIYDRCIAVFADDLSGNLFFLDMRRNSSTVDFVLNSYSVSSALGINEVIGCCKYGIDGIWFAGKLDNTNTAHRFLFSESFGSPPQHTSTSISSSYHGLRDTRLDWYQSNLRPWTWHWDGPFELNPAYPYDSDPWQANKYNVTRSHMDASAYSAESQSGAVLCFKETGTTGTSFTGQICALVINPVGNISTVWDIQGITNYFYDDIPGTQPDWYTQAPWEWDQLWRGPFLAYGGIDLRTVDGNLEITVAIHMRDLSFEYNPSWDGYTAIKYRATSTFSPPRVYQYVNGYVQDLLFPMDNYPGSRIFSDYLRIFVYSTVYGPRWGEEVVDILRTRINQRDDHKTSGAPRLRVNGRGSSAQEASRSRAGGNTYS